MAKSIMIQGTMSNAGKSLIVAGLCRIFKQDGYKVAPFKSQNMALNSFITDDGLEMGRAQVVQAYACGIAPSVEMNPILLKPTTDMGSQVIVNGMVRANMQAVEYYKNKKKLVPEILAAYEKLDKMYDIIVIEGAGSPAEINLKKDDIVNMGMAKMVNSPVLLVGDIDRGGVFAQLVGTIQLLEPDEVALIKGLIINKFRGDRDILEPGLKMLSDICHKYVLGVVPYMNVDIEDEDSLSVNLNKKNISANIDIAVIRLPKISNFTDFQSLAMMPEVSIRYVDKCEQLGNPDMIILPGTKNTIADLKWLRMSGLESMIIKKSQNNTLIFGICGGYQMLGEKLKDSLGVEGGGSIRGMCLLPIETEYTEEKVRTRVSGEILNLEGDYKKLSGSRIEGYEIHMGKTIHTQKNMQDMSIITDKTNNTHNKINNTNDVIEDSLNIKIKDLEKDIVNTQENKNICNMESDLHITDSFKKMDGVIFNNIAGTYIHGIFDSEDIRKALVELLYERAGLTLENWSTQSYEEYREKQFDILADEIRKNIDIKALYDIMQL